MTALGVGVVLLLLVSACVVAVAVAARRRAARPVSRDELALRAENHGVHGSREHGQSASPSRRADQGGWGA